MHFLYALFPNVRNNVTYHLTFLHYCILEKLIVPLLFSQGDDDRGIHVLGKHHKILQLRFSRSLQLQLYHERGQGLKSCRVQKDNRRVDESNAYERRR